MVCVRYAMRRTLYQQSFPSICKVDSAKNQITAADEPYTQPVTFFHFSPYEESLIPPAAYVYQKN